MLHHLLNISSHITPLHIGEGLVMGLLLLIILIILFIRHQRLLSLRARLMREALRNHDFTFRLPTTLLFPGERDLQNTLNEMGSEINRLLARSEVESWRRLTRVLTHEIMNSVAPIQSITQAYIASPMVKGTPLEERYEGYIRHKPQPGYLCRQLPQTDTAATCRHTTRRPAAICNVYPCSLPRHTVAHWPQHTHIGKDRPGYAAPSDDQHHQERYRGKSPLGGYTSGTMFCQRQPARGGHNATAARKQRRAGYSGRSGKRDFHPLLHNQEEGARHRLGYRQADDDGLRRQPVACRHTCCGLPHNVCSGSSRVMLVYLTP